MEPRRIRAPLDRDVALSLRAGDRALLSGEIYAARDAAHLRLREIAREGERMPFELEGAVIYYVGPTPAPPGRAIGSAGPTTSGRMDACAPALIELGLAGMIGKGGRSARVVEAMRAHGAVYFGAIGGAGALLMRCVEASEIVAYGDLGAEAIRRLRVRDMPLTVLIDSRGNDLYVEGRKAYLRHAEAEALKNSGKPEGIFDAKK